MLCKFTKAYTWWTRGDQEWTPGESHKRSTWRGGLSLNSREGRNKPAHGTISFSDSQSKHCGCVSNAGLKSRGIFIYLFGEVPHSSFRYIQSILKFLAENQVIFCLWWKKYQERKILMENEVESYVNVLNVVLNHSQNQAVQMSDTSNCHISHEGLQKLCGF